MDYLGRAIELAIDSAKHDGGPFGAVLVTADGQAFEGANAVTKTPDPTAHAEIVAIRAAARALGTHELDGSVMYASCEPCPMCLTACLWAHIPRIVYAATDKDAAEGGFDDRKFYEELREGMESLRSAQATHEPRENCTEPFRTFHANKHHIDY